MTSISLSFEHAQILFDALSNSMDFGSGFLDNDDIDALRALARAIRVPESEATPDEFMVNYYPELAGLRKYSYERSAAIAQIRARERAEFNED